MSFKESVQKKTVGWPTGRNFNINQWNDAYSKSTENDRYDESIFLAGPIFAEILNLIRDELTTLYECLPKTNKKELLLGHVALANRDTKILGDIFRDQVGKVKNLRAFSSRNNLIGSKISLQEIADGSLDSQYLAIKQISNLTSEPTASENPIEYIEFISREAYISQIYQIYEDYWQALVWSDYVFTKLNDKQFEIRREKSEKEISSYFSFERKSKLSTQARFLLASSDFRERFEGDQYIKLIGSGKNKRMAVSSVGRAADYIQDCNTNFRVSVLYLSDFLPENLLNEVPETKLFNVFECIEVLRLLSLLAIELNERYPKNDGVYSKNQLLQFSPVLNAIELKNKINKITEYDYKKLSAIFDFLCFTGEIGEDLWCHPLVPTSRTEVGVITSSLVAPSILRVAEHWLVTLGLDLQSKGDHFEKEVLKQFNSRIKYHEYSRCCYLARDIRAQIEGEEEQIDFLFKAGNTINIGEIKSIVTSDSPISIYRTYETLEGAVDQVERKKLFVAKHLKNIFEILEWEFDESEKYHIQSIVITSNPIFAGYSINEVPICDLRILNKYFEDNIYPLLSVNTGKDVEHYAWINLYINEKEFVNNFYLYLKCPPQLLYTDDEIEYEAAPIPAFMNQNNFVSCSRFFSRDVSAEEMLKKKMPFEVKTKDNIDMTLNEMDILI